MKMRFFTMMLLMVAFAFNSYATNPISPEAMDFEKTVKVEKKMTKAMAMATKFSKTKAGKWLVKKAVQANKLMNKLGIDLQDPVQKWLWYAIIGVLGGALIYITAAIVGIGAIWYIGYLLTLAGVVCFWYWVYLKFLQ